MNTHLHREINKIKERLLEQAADIEKWLGYTQKAVIELDDELAREICRHDKEINAEEVDIEEEILKLMALYQPVASDLRFVVAVLKINSDLERVGDLCQNIASYVIKINRCGRVDVSDKFRTMFPLVIKMLRESINAFIESDLYQASQLSFLDNQVDELNKEIIAEIKEKLRASGSNQDSLLFLFSASRAVERIGDYATNIAEDVAYMISGQIVRHEPELINELAEQSQQEAP